MSVARFIADQRTNHGVPHTIACALLAVSVSWYYKWIKRQPTARQQRRVDLDAAVRTSFNASGGTYGSPRVHADLLDDGRRVSVNTVADSMRRRLLACPMSEHPDASLAGDAIRIAAALRGGRQKIKGVIFHSDRGSTYTASAFSLLCTEKLGIRQSMGRVGSCFGNTAAESFFSTLEHEVLSRHHFATRAEARVPSPPGATTSTTTAGVTEPPAY